MRGARNGTPVVFLPKMHNPNLIISFRQTQIKAHSKKNWPVLFKTIKVAKNEAVLRRYPRLKEVKETWQLNATCGPELDLNLEKGC